ncbi:MAG: hypothetical protein HYU51_10235 [Candidatus Rokubacteria bacterium]|nr:hypothetical protein [Candidatus Rokubacteria bacterium]
MSWLWFSLVAATTLVPVFLSIPYFARNFHVRPDVFTSWYFGGVSIGVALWIALSEGAAALVPGGPRLLLGMLAVGVTFGAVANSSLFRAVAVAPNPGLPPVFLYSAASLAVFLASAALAHRLPRYFSAVSRDLDQLLGILLVMVGLFLIAGGWPLLRDLLHGR